MECEVVETENLLTGASNFCSGQKPQVTESHRLLPGEGFSTGVLAEAPQSGSLLDAVEEERNQRDVDVIDGIFGQLSQEQRRLQEEVRAKTEFLHAFCAQLDKPDALQQPDGLGDCPPVFQNTLSLWRRAFNAPSAEEEQSQLQQCLEEVSADNSSAEDRRVLARRKEESSLVRLSSMVGGRSVMPPAIRHATLSDLATCSPSSKRLLLAVAGGKGGGSGRADTTGTSQTACPDHLLGSETAGNSLAVFAFEQEARALNVMTMDETGVYHSQEQTATCSGSSKESSLERTGQRRGGEHALDFRCLARDANSLAGKMKAQTMFAREINRS